LKHAEMRQSYLQLESLGELKVNRKAQLLAQMLSCIRASTTDECALIAVSSGESHEIEVKFRPGR